MSIICDYRGLSSGCGTNVIYAFGDAYGAVNTSWAPLGGAQLAVAPFVNTKACKQAYEDLKTRFNIVYQCEPRRNANSGRMFFMVVYDGMKKK